MIETMQRQLLCFIQKPLFEYFNHCKNKDIELY